MVKALVKAPVKVRSNGVLVQEEPMVRSGGDIGQHTLCSMPTAIRETGYRR